MQIICTSLQTDDHASISSPLIFYRPDALLDTQTTVSKHWRQIHNIHRPTWNLPASSVALIMIILRSVRWRATSLSRPMRMSVARVLSCASSSMTTPYASSRGSDMASRRSIPSVMYLHSQPHTSDHNSMSTAVSHSPTMKHSISKRKENYKMYLR